MSSEAGILFQDLFNVTAINPEGRKYNNVSRLVCVGETYAANLTLDINTEVYPVAIGEKIKVAIAKTLRLDGKAGELGYDQSGQPSLLDDYEYGMCGRVFQYDYKKEHSVDVFASFGGLLMLLHGDQRDLKSIEMDSRVYCLVRKAAT